MVFLLPYALRSFKLNWMRAMCCKCTRCYQIDHDDVDGTWRELRANGTDAQTGRRCTMLPLTSTDMVGEVVMSPMSPFPPVCLIRVFYALLSFNICLRTRVRACALPSVGRTTFRARTDIESPPEVQPRLSSLFYLYPHGYVRRRTRVTTVVRPVRSRTNRSAFLILAYRKSHGSWDMLK